MYPVTPTFREAVRSNHKAVVKASIYRQGQEVLTIYPTSGDVSVDGQSATRRSLKLSVAADDARAQVITLSNYATYADIAGVAATYNDLASTFASYENLVYIKSETVSRLKSDLIPITAQDPLAPYGNEVRVWRGIQTTTVVIAGDNYQELAAAYTDYSDLATSFLTYSDMDTQRREEVVSDEFVPLGVFQITDVQIADTDAGVELSIDGFDRSYKVSRNKWQKPKTVPSGDVGTRLGNLLTDRYDDVELGFTTLGRDTAKVVLGQDQSSDPWSDMVEIADASGLDLFFDVDGVARLETYPVADVNSVLETYTLDEDGLLLSLDRRVSNEQTYNGVIVIVDNSKLDAPIRAEAWDEDPDSPTYRYGAYGEVPFFFETPHIMTSKEAQETAQRLLAKKQGLQEEISWSQIPNPALDVNDVVQVLDTTAGVRRVLIVDAMTIPLTIDAPMTVKARTIRTLKA